MADSQIPIFSDLMNPTLQALHQLGGSGSVSEIYDTVIQIMQLTDDQLDILHNPSKGNQTEVAYRLGWARTYLKKAKLISNSSRGVWALTADGNRTGKIDPKEIVTLVRQLSKNTEQAGQDELLSSSDAEDLEQSWREELASVLSTMRPEAFERLFQRILRESGFTQVDVTGRSGDGGIDGNGVIRIGGFLSFRVLFQCKRYKGTVGAGVVRDFRGAMVGRTDKGLIVTTGNFTTAAQREATRDGAPEIDLIDGEQLIDKLKELSLGVQTEEVIVEQVTINRDFFDHL